MTNETNEIVARHRWCRGGKRVFVSKPILFGWRNSTRAYH